MGHRHALSLRQDGFTGGQFNEGFLDRYIPWHEGDFYSQDDLLRLQQQLIDADYFAVVDVMPEPTAHDGVVPIIVTLGPAKRNVYTAGMFLDTDIGFGVRGGLTRRWLNDKGHKLKAEVQIAQKLRNPSATYSIPLPGPNNRSYNFGANLFERHGHANDAVEDTEPGRERNAQWLGFTRTLGMQSADRQSTSTIRTATTLQEQEHHPALSGTGLERKKRRRSDCSCATAIR